MEAVSYTNVSQFNMDVEPTLNPQNIFMELQIKLFMKLKYYITYI
jgi:hypothetical protein